MVFYLIGLGLGDAGDITVNGLNIVFLESYTSMLSHGLSVANLEQLYGRTVLEADRELVEQRIESLLDEARSADIALLVVGDPFGATTHAEFVLRARAMDVPLKVIHNASIMSAIGCCGLQLYNFGLTVSIPLWTDEWKPDSFLDKILLNRRNGMHTLCLLDIKVKEQTAENLIKGNRIFEPPHFLTCPMAAQQMLNAATERRKCLGKDQQQQQRENNAEEHCFPHQHNAAADIDERTMVVGMARVGWANQQILHCSLGQMASADLGLPLHVLIVPATDEKLHPIEREMLQLFSQSLFTTIVTFPMLQRAYVGMQCFWGVESSFASMAGVLHTRVGYAGGTSPAPTYANIGDHTEVTELQFDPSCCSYEQILDWFFTHHDPTQRHKKQYASAILWVDESQHQTAEKAMEKANAKYGGRVQTYLNKLDQFHQAEDYHQKYWLRTQRAIFGELNLSDSEVVSSTLAAKLNAFIGGGYTDFDALRQLQKQCKLSDKLIHSVEQIARAGGVGGCH
ncbi:hypothetical protein niasHT_000119 [Heterodera trifolii]|uniref:Peptide-methionine (S)-S-oxide reductase n=1 Tax=Heterodera trifolii TaxID=157864 RepID=A0ABD2LSH3_9BILA